MNMLFHLEFDLPEDYLFDSYGNLTDKGHALVLSIAFQLKTIVKNDSRIKLNLNPENNNSSSFGNLLK